MACRPDSVTTVVDMLYEAHRSEAEGDFDNAVCKAASHPQWQRVCHSYRDLTGFELGVDGGWSQAQAASRQREKEALLRERPQHSLRCGNGGGGGSGDERSRRRRRPTTPSPSPALAAMLGERDALRSLLRAVSASATRLARLPPETPTPALSEATGRSVSLAKKRTTLRVRQLQREERSRIDQALAAEEARRSHSSSAQVKVRKRVNSVSKAVNASCLSASASFAPLQRSGGSGGGSSGETECERGTCCGGHNVWEARLEQSRDPGRGTARLGCADSVHCANATIRSPESLKPRGSCSLSVARSSAAAVPLPFPLSVFPPARRAEGDAGAAPLDEAAEQPQEVWGAGKRCGVDAVQVRVERRRLGDERRRSYIAWKEAQKQEQERQARPFSVFSGEGIGLGSGVAGYDGYMRQVLMNMKENERQQQAQGNGPPPPSRVAAVLRSERKRRAQLVGDEQEAFRSASFTHAMVRSLLKLSGPDTPSF